MNTFTNTVKAVIAVFVAANTDDATATFWEVQVQDPHTNLYHTIGISVDYPRLGDLQKQYPGCNIRPVRVGQVRPTGFRLGEICDFSELNFSDLATAPVSVEELVAEITTWKGSEIHRALHPRDSKFQGPSLVTSRRRGVNRDHNEAKAQEYQLWLMGTRTFAPFTQEEADFNEEEEFFSSRDLDIERKVVNGLRSIVGSTLKKEGITLTNAQAKRLRKKSNKAKGGYVRKVTPPKRKVSKVVIKVAYMAAVTAMVRGNKLALRRERKEIMAIAVASRRLLDAFRGFTLDMSGLVDLACDAVQINQMKERHMNLMVAWNNNMEVK
jgi:hypothetical protein